MSGRGGEAKPECLVLVSLSLEERIDFKEHYLIKKKSVLVRVVFKKLGQQRD